MGKTWRGLPMPMDVTAPRCDYCDEGDVAVNGWHTYTDDELQESYRVPCAVTPPEQ